jgi:hypothetical protein
MKGLNSWKQFMLWVTTIFMTQYIGLFILLVRVTGLCFVGPLRKAL